MTLLFVRLLLAVCEFYVSFLHIFLYRLSRTSWREWTNACRRQKLKFFAFPFRRRRQTDFIVCRPWTSFGGSFSIKVKMFVVLVCFLFSQHKQRKMNFLIVWTPNYIQFVPLTFFSYAAPWSSTWTDREVNNFYFFIFIFGVLIRNARAMLSDFTRWSLSENDHSLKLHN